MARPEETMDGIRWMWRVAPLLFFVTASILPAFAQSGKRHASPKNRAPNLELTGFRPFTPSVSVDDTVKMTAAGNYVFILVGRRLYKVDQRDLRVVQSRLIDFDDTQAMTTKRKKAGKQTKRRTKKTIGSRSRNKLTG